jgi:hypothetical protein
MKDQSKSLLGGPTIFVQAPDSDVWGEFELPEGKRVENGDKFTLFDCRFKGVLYQELPFPEAMNSDAESEEVLKRYRERIKQDDVRMTFVSDPMKFVTLVPLTD